MTNRNCAYKELEKKMLGIMANEKNALHTWDREALLP